MTAPAGAAFAQDAPRVGRDGFREGVPGVLSAPRPPPRPPESPFAAAYRRAGHPRMVLFFNRDITDAPSSDVQMSRREVTTVERDARLSARGQASPPAGDTPPPPARSAGVGPAKQDSLAIQEPPPATEAPPADLPPGKAEAAPPLPDAADRQPLQRQVEIDQRGRVQEERRTDISVQRPALGGRQGPLDEAGQWQFETAFTNRLAADHVRLVDRAVALRLAAVLRGATDPQRLEMAAIRDHADVVVLVRTAASATAQGGHIYRITALETRRGTILADDVVAPPSQPPAGAGAQVAGTATAKALIDRLTATWTPR